MKLTPQYRLLMLLAVPSLLASCNSQTSPSAVAFEPSRMTLTAPDVIPRAVDSEALFAEVTLAYASQSGAVSQTDTASRTGNSNTWNIALDVPANTQFTLDITWFDLMDPQRVNLTTLSRTVIAGDANSQLTLVFDFSEYDDSNFNIDNDEFTNLEERENGTSPFFPDGPGDDDLDTDADSVNDLADNCPTIANTDQLDTDSDGLGDVCDPFNNLVDPDEDGVDNPADNCPSNPNPDQADIDQDGVGDVCDGENGLDPDNDNVNNPADNCPFDANSDQLDTDADGVGDACDPFNNLVDPDEDGVDNPADNCPTEPNPEQGDIDQDGIGDVCDNSNGLDPDNDGVNDPSDNCPFDANANQLDSDADGLGDACDPFDNLVDPDEDGVDNPADNCPVDANPNQADVDGDGIGDVCDSTNGLDPDNDGVNNPADNCPIDANPNQQDTDGDGLGDACDPFNNVVDPDEDGIDNPEDNCPVDANPTQLDTDEDGLGDACDPFNNLVDPDEDGVDNPADNCPITPNPDQLDLNQNGIGDACEEPTQYIDLPLNTRVTGSLVAEEFEYYRMSGANYLNLISVAGNSNSADADIAVFSDELRINEVCASSLPSAVDSCDQLSPNTIYYIEVAAFSAVQYSLVAAFAVDLGTANSDGVTTVDGTVLEDNSDFYRITGVFNVFLKAPRSEAALLVYAASINDIGSSNSLLICSAVSGDPDEEICDEVESDNSYYVEVIGVTDVNYSLVFNQLPNF